MTTPDPHTLNARLAEICGIPIVEKDNGKGELYWVVQERDDDVGWFKEDRWFPDKDASQMEIVKAWLKEHGYSYRIWFQGILNVYRVWVFQAGYFDHEEMVEHPDSELLALALAICAAIPKEET